jgi:hypothetical protein
LIFHAFYLFQLPENSLTLKQCVKFPNSYMDLHMQQ